MINKHLSKINLETIINNTKETVTEFLDAYLFEKEYDYKNLLSKDNNKILYLGLFFMFILLISYVLIYI